MYCTLVMFHIEESSANLKTIQFYDFISDLNKLYLVFVSCKCSILYISGRHMHQIL